QAAQGAAGLERVVLAHHFVEGARAHPHRKRRTVVAVAVRQGARGGSVAAEGEEVLVHGLRVGRSPDGARRGPTRACGPARWRSRPGWRGGAGWSEGWRAGALPGVGWVLGPAWWVLGPARWAPGCRPRGGGRVGGVGAAEVAGPGLGEVFGDLDAGSVEVVDDGDNVAAGADAPPGPAGLGRGGGQSGGVQQAVGLVEVVLPAQQVEVLYLGESALPLGAAQAFLDVVAFGGPGGRPGAARHRAHAVAQSEMFEHRGRGLVSLGRQGQER